MTTPRRTLALTVAASMAILMAASPMVAAPMVPAGDESADAVPVLEARSRGHGRSFTHRWRLSRPGGPRHLPRLGLARDLIRSETIVDAGEAGIVARRVERGEAVTADELALTISLANGETGVAELGEATRVYALGQDPTRRRARTRLSQAAITDVAAGDTVIVWSQSVDGGPFVASRVIVLAAPAVSSADGGATDPTAAPEVEVSPAPAG